MANFSGVLYCTLLLLVVTLGLTDGQRAASTLQYVSLVFRHGDRSPHSIYPKDINQVDKWPDGLGWMTALGIQQQFELGEYFRTRYDSFFNTSYYKYKEIRVESSSVHRCVMSALATLAGMFPPQGPQVWNPNLLWQPVPLTSTPRELDNKIAMKAPCPRYDDLKKELLTSEKLRKVYEDNKDFIAMLSNETGIEDLTLQKVWNLGDPLICERAHNMTWNAWAYQPGVTDTLFALVADSYDYLYGSPPEMARLKGGPLLKEILSNMQTAAAQSPASPKVYMYSVHDSTVAALLGAMHVFEPHIPMYGNTIMVELHKVGGEDKVQIFYRNATDAPPVELVPPGCEGPCTLNQFEQVTKDTVPVDWAKECGIEPQSNNTGANLLPGLWLVVLGVLATILVTRDSHHGP